MRTCFRPALLAVVAAVVVLSASVASAHLALIDPPSRYGGDVLKDGPCGMAGGTRSTNILTVEPGATLLIRWDEYINHPGHYRIAFDDDGDDDFMDPPCLSNCDTRDMVIGVAPGDYTDPTVLADGIPDMAGGEYTFEVTLPDIECDNCTLQVIQIMTDKPPYTSGGNDIYYQCVDLVLSAGAGGDGGVVMMDGGTPDTGTGGGDTGTSGGDTGTGGGDTGTGGGDTGTGGGGDDGGGCSASGTPGGAAPLALIAMAAGLLGLRRRRRR
jgi:MYXO-CTERM domain-containing protein